MAGGRSGKRSLPPTAFCLLLTAHCLLLLKSRRSGKRDLRYACFTAYRSLPTVLPHPQFPVPVRYSLFLFPVPYSLFPIPYPRAHRPSHSEGHSQLEKEVPPDLQIHLIVDNYSTHKGAEVVRWLKPKSAFDSTFTLPPPAVPGLIRWKRWFGLITERMIRRGTFHSVPELESAIYQWLATWNNQPKPFVWRATADVILDKVRRCKELTGTPH